MVILDTLITGMVAPGDTACPVAFAHTLALELAGNPGFRS